MNTLPLARSRLICGPHIIAALCAVTLLVSLVTGARFSAMPAPRIQAALLTLADQRPDAPVGVIVETLANTNDVKDTIIQLGGVVTKQLPIIHALAAELPAKAVLSLGKASGVRWVSLDAPMVKSICDVCKDTSHLENAYVQSIGASRLWNEAPGYLQGQGIGVAVVDSGVNEKALRRVLSAVRSC